MLLLFAACELSKINMGTTEQVDTDCCAPEGCCCGCWCVNFGLVFASFCLLRLDSPLTHLRPSHPRSSMPHGKLVLFPTIMLSIAAALSVITLWNCEFVEPVRSSYGYAGFWPICVSVPSSSPYSYSYDQYLNDHHRDDPTRKAAMSFGLLAGIVGTGAMIALWPM